jgi:hypothetical protein
VAKKFSNMSIEELEAYRDQQQGILNEARANFRKAGKFLDAALQGQSVEDLKAAAEALAEKIADMEESDG